jgi:hypothetical protein
VNSEFLKRLTELINEFSLENGSDTPDFILASYLTECLRNYESVIGMREIWYGRNKPNSDKPVTLTSLESK